MKTNKQNTIEKSKMEGTFTITCYGSTKTYRESERAKMMKEFMEGMAMCDGSEQERYTNIYLDLARGAKECTDEYEVISTKNISRNYGL